MSSSFTHKQNAEAMLNLQKEILTKIEKSIAGGAPSDIIDLMVKTATLNVATAQAHATLATIPDKSDLAGFL